MNKYLLILRDHEEKWDAFSQEELKTVIDKFQAWNKDMMNQQQLVGAGKLTSDLGKTVKPKGAELIIDGPFSEAKEAIAGYYCIQAENIQTASEIAKGCPILTYGGSVEVREMASVLG